MYIQAINPINEAHLMEVVEAMREMGAPEIRAYYTGEMYVALEGSHRLAAAWELGLEPVIVEMDEDEEIEHDLDYVDAHTVGDILGEMVGHTGEVYELEMFDIEYR